MKPFFSIITINFNNLRGLKRTIVSVINQTYFNIEYIVIDGGSKDGSKEYIQDNASSLDYWVSEPDNGIYHAMNKGIEKANGNYLLFLNSGDYLFNEKTLEICFNEIVGTEKTLKSNLIFVGSSQNERSKLVFNPPAQFSLFHFYHNSIPHQAEFISLKLLKKSNYSTEYEVVSDWINNIQFLLLGANFIRLKKIEIVAITEDEGISSSSKNALERKLFIEKNSHLFHRFEFLMNENDLNKLKQFDLFNQFINRNFLTKLFWKLIRIKF